MKLTSRSGFGILALVSLLVAYNISMGNSPSPHQVNSSPSPSSTKSTILMVSVAASLQNAIESLDTTFESAYPNIQINYNFAASGSLQQQIEQGASVDLLISAASKQIDVLQEKNLIVNDTRRHLLTNNLVLVVPRDSPLDLTKFQHLTDPEIKRISIGEPRSVPAGQYAAEVFKNLGIWEQ